MKLWRNAESGVAPGAKLKHSYLQGYKYVSFLPKCSYLSGTGLSVEMMKWIPQNLS